MTIYDREYTFSCLIEIPPLKKGHMKEARKTLEKYNAVEIKSPGVYAEEARKYLSTHGYPMFKGDYPIKVNSGSAMNALVNACIKKIRPTAMITTQINTAFAPRTVESKEHLRQIVDQLASQQDIITIGFMYHVGDHIKQGHKVAFSLNRSPIHDKLCKFVLTPNEEVNTKSELQVFLKKLDEHITECLNRVSN